MEKTRDKVVNRACEYIDLIVEAEIQRIDGQDEVAGETENRAGIALDLLKDAVLQYKQRLDSFWS